MTTTTTMTTTTMTTPTMTVSATTDQLIELGKLVIAGAKTTTALLEQIASCSNSPLTEQSIIDWAIAGGAWLEELVRPRSLWQEVSRGKRSGGKPSCRWSLVGSLDKDGCLVLFEYKIGQDNLETRLPIEQVAGLGRLCAAAANRKSQEKAKAKAQESETLLRKASLEKTRERQERELAETVYKQGQEKLYETLARELQEMRFWQGNAPELFPAFASPSARLLAERNWQYQNAVDAKKNRELQEKYALWRNKRKEQIALAMVKQQEQAAKEQERKEKERVKNALLLQNYASIIKSIKIACNKLPVTLNPGKNKQSQDMAAVLQEIRYLLQQEQEQDNR